MTGIYNMKIYEDFEKAYKIITESEHFQDINVKEECDPQELSKDPVIDKLISFYTKSEDYEKCSVLLKIKCWRARQNKKYNL